MDRKLRTTGRLALALISALTVVALHTGTTLAGRGFP